MIKQLTIFVSCLFLLSGCVTPMVQPLINAENKLKETVAAQQKKQVDQSSAKIKCQEACQQAVTANGRDFSSGPCLSNEVIEDWACDIVHVPRLPADNDPANQCASFREGKVQHFVEVDLNCTVVDYY